MASDKITIVGGRVIVAGTGQVGLGQRFAAIVQQAHDNNLFQQPVMNVSTALAAAGIQNFASTSATRSAYGALLAAPIEDQAHLIEYAVQDFQPEVKTDKLNFVAMGSGQALAEPFVSFVNRTFWGSTTPDVKSGVFGVHWALIHTITCAPGGVGEPIVIAKLTKGEDGWKAELLSDEELLEQREHMVAIEERIAKYKDEMLGTVEPEAVPKPEPAPPAPQNGK